MIRKHLVTSFLFAAAAVVPASSALANLIAYDPFLSGNIREVGEYTAGTDMRTMGAAALGWAGTGGIDGFGISHAGTTGNFQANAGGEDSAAVEYEQGGRMQWLGVGNFPFNRNLTRQLNPYVSTGTLWMSIMTNRLGWVQPPNADNVTYAVGGFVDAAGNGLQVGYDDTAGDGAPDLVLRVNGVNELLAADTVSSDNQLVIVRLDIDPAGDETISAWADPATLALGAPDLTLTTDITSSLSPFTQSKYESPGQSGVVFWDEIRLATTFESVTGIPEPTAGVLALIAAAACGRVRRG
ncbi:MAG: hypothetical protein AAFV43_00285 [Planctomycetota bacterium]